MTEPAQKLPVPFMERVIAHAWQTLEHHTDLGGCYHLLENLYDVELKFEREHRRVVGGQPYRSYRITPEYAARAFIMRNVYEAPKESSTDLNVLSNYKLTLVGSYMLAHRMRSTRTAGRATPPYIFDHWVADISYADETRYPSPMDRIGGRVGSLEGWIGELLRNERLKWGMEVDVPLVVAIDYARDIGE